MHPDPGPSTPRADHPPPETAAEFLRVLAAPHRPPPDSPPLGRAQPHPAHVARCRAAVDWTPTPPTEASSSCPHAPAASQLDQPVYVPHGPWAWTHGLPIDAPRQLLSLQKGAQCTASIDSGTVAGKEIKYICRKWKLSKQKEWYGFYSELALYKSEQYLQPLQGDVVPHIIGVHVMPEAVSVTMEVPHSSFWIESSPSMPDVLKERVIAAFEKIHAQGVLHGDPELRHMLIGADGKVTVIDFGMSRALREHTSLGIERAEPEEFRLEMRKVKYKLDYKGARRKEGDKVDDYLRRVRRNRKISDLWKRRAKGERVGPIPQYEEEPEEYQLDPPVNAHDFQEDWITASDDRPIRVVVPGQTPEQVANQVHALLAKLETMRSVSPPHSASPPSSSARHGHVQHQHDGKYGSSPHASSGGPEARRPKKRLSGRASDLGSPSRCQGDPIPVCARQIEGTSRRRDYIRHRHLRNTYITSVSSNPDIPAAFPSSVDVPEKPQRIRPEEYRRIEESRRHAMLEYARAPKGILKRRRDDDGGADPTRVPEDHRVSKKLRFPEWEPCRGRTPVLDAKNRRRTRVVGYGRAPKRLRPEVIDFTLPSLRTLSALVGSLMPWVHCQ